MTLSSGKLWGHMRIVVVIVLALACARQGAPPTEAKLAPGARLLSAEAQRSAWCPAGQPATAPCEDFRPVPVAEVVRFEREFPAILRARGFSREAGELPSYERLYWSVFRGGRLYVRGSLVCGRRLNEDGIVLAIPICPFIEVTFPAGAPQRVDFLVH